MITSSEEFPGEMLTPKSQFSLPNSVYELLVKYYNDTYDLKFVSIAELAASSDLLSSSNSNQLIVVLPIVTKFGRIRIAAKIFGFKSAPQYQRSLHILAKFIQIDETTNIYPGHVQFYFKHTVQFPTGFKTHQLAFVNWYLWTPSEKIRFHCRTDDLDD